MVEVKKYQLPPTSLIPNSPQPLLHYPGLLATEVGTVGKLHDLYDSNGWRTQWIFRYGPTQTSHYHSRVHECMTVLTGTATIRFGVADTSDDMEENTRGSDKEDGGIYLQAKAGDVFILPAGTAHKTFDAKDAEGEDSSFALLTPGDGHGIASEDARQALEDINLTGFTMLGAYPKGGGEWDFAKGGENEGDYEKVWAIPKPESDPVLGKAEEGICGAWQ